MGYLDEVRNNNAFGIIRMICCLVVIYEHAVGMSGSRLINFHLQGYAVETFFIISGFWVTDSYRRSRSIRDYAVKRCKRLLPIYWTVIIISVLLLSLNSVLSLKRYFTSAITWKYLICNLFFANFLQPNLPGVFEGNPWSGAVNGALWTMKIEVGFYFLLPFFLWIKKKLSSDKIWVVIMISISFMSVSFQLFYSYIGIPETLGHQLPSFIGYFITGMLGVEFIEKFRGLLENRGGDLLFLGCTIMFVLSIIGKSGRCIPIAMPFFMTWIIIWCGIKLYRIGKTLNIDLSYPMYLCHFPIIQLIIYYRFFEKNTIISLISIICITFTGGYFLKRFEGIVKSLFKKQIEI